MLQGAAVGLIIWAIIAFVGLVSIKPGHVVDYPKITLTAVVIVVLCGAIGFLINGY